jgi:hypothetical protein
MMVPWCAPGYAKVLSPCGLFAGGYNQKAVDMIDLDSTPVEVWRAGTEQNISWAITANHGGGYAYRLCRHGPDQTEECFQKGHLQFVGDFQYIEDDNSVLKAQVRVCTSSPPTPAASLSSSLYLAHLCPSSLFVRSRSCARLSHLCSDSGGLCMSI